MKKFLKIFILILLSLFFIFEIYFYSNFGEGRKLTKGEIRILKEIYGEKIKYDEVKIYSRKFLPSPLQPDNFAMSPNGNIYFPEKYFEKDFSKSKINKEAWFVHEAMHIKQYQKEGQWFTWKAAILSLERIFGFDPYAYKINFDKNLEDYNYEQQGDIARDYFLYLKTLRGKNKNISQKIVHWYQKILDIKK